MPTQLNPGLYPLRTRVAFPLRFGQLPSYPKIFYWLILINLTLDIFSFWSEPGGLTAILRVAILYAVFFYFLLINKIKLEKNIYIPIFVVYAMAQVLLAVDLEYSLRVTLQVVTSMLMFFVGYSLIRSEYDFYYYLKQFFYVYLLIIFNTIISNVFEIGLDDYTKSTDYVVGGLDDLWVIYTFSLIMLPLLLYYRVSKKWLLYSCAFLVMILLIISVKRIAILGLGFSALCFFLFYQRKAELIKKTSVFIILAAISSPMFLDLLTNRIKARTEAGRFESDFYESEGRFLEIKFLQEWLVKFEDPVEILFGLKAFESRGVVGAGLRNFHIDYMIISYTLGILGLFIYGLIYFRLFGLLLPYFSDIKGNRFLNLRFRPHVVTAITLTITSLIISVGGQINYVTYRTMLFLTLGAIIRMLGLGIKQINVISHANPYRL